MNLIFLNLLLNLVIIHIHPILTSNISFMIKQKLFISYLLKVTYVYVYVIDIIFIIVMINAIVQIKPG